MTARDTEMLSCDGAFTNHATRSGSSARSEGH
jgi:hypothetical protein